MISFGKKIQSRWFVVLVCILMCFLYYHFFMNRAHVEVTIEVTKSTNFKIYWAKKGQDYSEKRMERAWASPNHKEYKFFLTDLKKVERLRIDPMQYEGTSRINKIVITQEGFEPISFTTKEEFQQLKPLNDIKEYSIEENGLSTISTGIDPYFEFPVHLQPKPTTYTDDVLRLLAVAILIFFIYWHAADLKSNLGYVPIMLGGVVLLVMTMAVNSDFNVHPDEVLHFTSTKYYSDNWNPPHVDDPAIRATYSPYGVSRLTFNEIYYLLNGKFMHLFTPMHITEHVASRLMNVMLFLLIVSLTISSISARYVALPLLVSPQVWYTFSYCNSDAFGVFATFLVAWLIVDRGSVLHRFLTGKVGILWLIRGLIAGLCMGLLLVVKKNFYPFIGVAIVFLIMDIWRNFTSSERKKLFVRLGVLCLIGGSLFMYKKAADYAVNGLDRAEKVRLMKFETAKPEYHPDTPLKKKHSFLYWKERGIPIKHMIYEARWFEKTFRSAFGVYGYTSISGGFGYYELVRWCGLALLVYYFAVIAIRGGVFYNIQAATVVGASVALIAASFYHSYVNDFQAQGRYLLPIFTMLAMLSGQTRAFMEKRFFSFGILVMFLLSAYSFIGIALQNIPRTIF